MRWRATIWHFWICALCLTALVPTHAWCAPGDCGQPLTTGTVATASDSLLILQAAIDSKPCRRACACDVDGSGAITASDALRSLKNVVGGSVSLLCDCPDLTCASGVVLLGPDSYLDAGRTGFAHGKELVVGELVTFDIRRRCDESPGTECLTDFDCPSGACGVSCDCDDPSTSACEITRAAGKRRCRGSGTPCATNADCDALPQDQCTQFFGPPMPLQIDGVPYCIATELIGDFDGTVDIHSGEMAVGLPLRLQPVFVYAEQEKPCPRCGAPADAPAIGDTYLCEGGLQDGAACTVDGLSRVFGGVSADCPPALVTDVGHPVLVDGTITFTTGEQLIRASLRIPGLLNLCVDDLSECTTNNDCRRCTDDLSPCVSNVDCSGDAACGVAPAHPITCGPYAHCGLCSSDPDRPCSEDSECASTDTCVAPSYILPSSCNDLVCGRSVSERCCRTGDPGCAIATPEYGVCSTKEYLACEDDITCATESAGQCLLDRARCFEHVISRAGAAAGIGGRCVGGPDPVPCSTDADCSVGRCFADTTLARLVSVGCSLDTQPYSIWTSRAGLPGPIALTLDTLIQYCRCGDGFVGCSEACDDGNLDNGDGCSQACTIE